MVSVTLLMLWRMATCTLDAHCFFVFSFFPMLCLVWNYQGAASRSFKRALCHLILIHKPSIVCLLEPKVSGSQANSICSSIGYEEWVRVEAVGFSGGIQILWNRSLNIQIIDTHPQFITLQVFQENLGWWRLSIIYGSPNLYLRRRLFTNLTCANSNFQGPWLMAGDFNSVTSQEEVNNSESFSLTRCTDFNEWLFREGLIDLGYTGTQFTWMRGTNPSTFKATRLDRALGNVEWKLRFPDTLVEHLPMICSDHTPLLINTSPSSESIKSKAFMFNMAWVTDPSFFAVVHQNWKREGSRRIIKLAQLRH